MVVEIKGDDVDLVSAGFTGNGDFDDQRLRRSETSMIRKMTEMIVRIMTATVKFFELKYISNVPITAKQYWELFIAGREDGMNMTAIDL